MTARAPGARYETCKQCGQIWNVSIKTVLDWRGYLCPKCREKLRKRDRK